MSYNSITINQYSIRLKVHNCNQFHPLPSLRFFTQRRHHFNILFICILLRPQMLDGSFSVRKFVNVPAGSKGAKKCEIHFRSVHVYSFKSCKFFSTDMSFTFYKHFIETGKYLKIQKRKNKHYCSCHLNSP